MRSGAWARPASATAGRSPGCASATRRRELDAEPSGFNERDVEKILNELIHPLRRSQDVLAHLDIPVTTIRHPLRCHDDHGERASQVVRNDSRHRRTYSRSLRRVNGGPCNLDATAPFRNDAVCKRTIVGRDNPDSASGHRRRHVSDVHNHRHQSAERTRPLSPTRTPGRRRQCVRGAACQPRHW